MPWWCWIIGVCGVWISTFGPWLTFVPAILFLSFLFGAISYLFKKTKRPLDLFYENINRDVSIRPGIRKVLEDDYLRQSVKFDQRLTGSQIIDEGLQDIISFLMRDFVTPWYQKVSAEVDFENATRESLQKVVISIATRMKEVEWISYLTTRLVDDAASHLQLFRQASEKIKAEAVKKSTPQTLASFKSATEGCHSRNNSDCGVNTKLKTHSRNNSMSDKPGDLETMFFRVEAEQATCHEQLCTNREAEMNYFAEIVDTILYMVLAEDDFQCLPARQLVREIVIGGVLVPLVDMISDPDFVNRCIVWLCSDITSDAFLSTLRVTTEKKQLVAILDFVNKEIAFLRSRDGGGGHEADLVKQQINSLMYIKKAIDHKLQGGSQVITPLAPEKLLKLSLSVILSNSLELSYFIDYLSTQDAQNYVFLHLAIESWKSSVVAELHKGDGKISKSQVNGLREAAVGIYQQYMVTDALNFFDPMMYPTLLSRITHDVPTDSWFDELQNTIYKNLNEKMLPDFYRSNIYLKLLSDLELLKDEDDSPDGVSLSGSIDDDEASTSPSTCYPDHAEHKKPPECGQGKFELKVDIIDNGVVQDRSKTYGIYALSVLKTYENGFTKQWHVYRRYSDFYDLQQKIRDLYADLGKLPFPGKKTFNNMGALTLAKRMKMLNDYLQILLHSGVAENHPRLPSLLLSFLEPAEYDKSLTLGSAFESVVGPIKSSMKSVSAAVRTVPDILNVVDNLSLSKKKEKDENVPVRIMLLLMDEVFDLQSRNQWLRRRIVVLLRQIFGDIFTRKMLDYVEELTGASRVAGYISSIKGMLWPNGVRAVQHAPRDEACLLRTQVMAKASLLSAADDFKHVLGSETTRRGLIRVFDTFQHAGLNRRLVHILFEGVSELIFPPMVDIHLKLLQNKRTKYS